MSLLKRVRDVIAGVSMQSPSRFAVLVFTAIIFFWSLLLWLPISAADGQATAYHEALFTAVSTICVTGLSVVDMGTHWSTFGNVVIFLGIEVGAVGVLTLASILGTVVTRKLGLKQRLIAASDGNALRLHRGAVSESQAVRLGEVGGVLVTVALSLIVIETVIALLILPVFIASDDYQHWWDAVAHSFYYAASAFTNTGFAPNPGGVEIFAGNAYFLGCLGLAVFLGSLGFPVIFSLARWVRTRQHLGVHVKLTIVTTTILFLLGWLVIWLLEVSNPKTIGGHDAAFGIFTGGFLSVMTRSGGFANVDINALNDQTIVVMDLLMFVGGGSASTAGGIKVTTLAILFLAAVAEARGVEDLQVFRRRIPVDVLRLAVAITLWAVTIVAVSSILVMQLSGAGLREAVFDTISAFATVGLTTGLTAEAPPAATMVLAVTMWLGRVGTVTFAAALASSERRQLYRLPEERIIVG
ncbi:TrkH family potassium uptake protein [Gulosibacter macacae]|uniref:TrkH family potassium uptake protein n=1 Tax=Gulosibacter macacae TaxID=2488791 RepID=UPI00163AA50B|nr:potassium transporter TrkG [Gulosibacter macacae]